VAKKLLGCVSGLGLVAFFGGCGQVDKTVAPPPVTVSVTPQAAALQTSHTMQFMGTVTGDSGMGVTWSVNGTAGGGSTTGTIDASGNYTAPTGATGLVATITATSKKDGTKSASATVNVVPPGVISAAPKNVQVAVYTITPPANGNVSVQFGTDANYGLTTWTQPTPAGGGAVSLFVAGMKGNTLYHMRGVVKFGDGTTFMEADQTFTTGAPPAALVPTVTTTTTAGMTPQSGVEVLQLTAASSAKYEVAITDLNGALLWAYDPGTSVPAGTIPNPVKLLANGHFLMNFSGNPVDGTNSVLQEVDLGGNVVWQMTAAQLNAALAAATCSGCNITVIGTHHDFAELPNGHLIVLASLQNTVVDAGTTVIGDALIDLDQNRKPVWVWNAFDHPTNLANVRRPMGYPDWLHSNAVVYSKDDKNLIMSMRHQNWLVKVNYADGSGDGSVLWRLGFAGDFALMSAPGVPDADGTHWFFAQHAPSFVTANTAGKFSLVLFDNGNDRSYPLVEPSSGSCGATPACFSTVPVFDIDETAMTATFKLHPTTPEYSFFGGNAAALANGHLEFCESAGGPGTAGDIYEMTADSSAQIVWHMLITGQFAYRGQRLPSMYPGVQW